MVSNSGFDNRRQHVRVSKEVDFYCYVDGQRFDSASVDISAGGAFLSTADELRIGAVVLIFPKPEKGKDNPAMLVGRVVRAQAQAPQGLGVRWDGCISKQGVQGIADFLADYLEIDAATLPTPDEVVMGSKVAAYEFGKGRFYVPSVGELPDLEQVAATGQIDPVGWAGLATPQPEALLARSRYSHSQESGAVTTILSRQRGRLPVSVPVELVVDDMKHTGRITALGITSIYVSMPKQAEVVRGQVRVFFPVPIEKPPLVIRLHCEVMRKDRPTRVDAGGLDLAVRMIEQRQHPGVFERYVKFLFYRLYSRME